MNESQGALVRANRLVVLALDRERPSQDPEAVDEIAIQSQGGPGVSSRLEPFPVADCHARQAEMRVRIGRIEIECSAPLASGVAIPSGYVKREPFIVERCPIRRIERKSLPIGILRVLVAAHREVTAGEMIPRTRRSWEKNGGAAAGLNRGGTIIPVRGQSAEPQLLEPVHGGIERSQARGELVSEVFPF